MTGLIIPPGTHVVELVETRTGAVLIKTPPLEMRPDMLHTLAVFGPANALKQRWFVDDPALLTDGLTHTRVLNALVGGDPLSGGAVYGYRRRELHGAGRAGRARRHGGSRPHRRANWTGSAGSGAAPGSAPAVNGLGFRRPVLSGNSRFAFQMPVRVQATGSGGPCPSCVESSF